MTDELPPLVAWARDPLASEVQRLMHHYRLNNGDELYRTMRDYAAAAVAREREACAKLCKELDDMGNGADGRQCAAAIRSR